MRAAGDDVLVAGMQDVVFHQHRFDFVQRRVVVGAGCQNQRAHAPVHRHTALGGNARGQRENRQGNIVAADFKGGRTAFGQGDDGFGVNRARHADRASGNR